MFEKTLAVLFVGFMSYAYRVMQPPSNICGTPDGPPVTSPKIRHSHGRYLAYKEHGVSRDQEKHKIVFIHGYDFNRQDVCCSWPLSGLSSIYLNSVFIS
uniref:Uncharacterized protein n=1 Tax=Solanum tuberosum TaxID=4113 RepID=M1AUI2_SOLTU